MANARQNSSGLKKRWTLFPRQQKVRLIEKLNPSLPLARQAALLGISRSSLYYAPRDRTEDILTLRALDELFTRYPFYGSRRMQDGLRDEYGIVACRERVQGLMHELGIHAIYPKKRMATSLPGAGHQIYPYLLKGLPITHPNHIWGTDITYVRLASGFCYLVAILDWFSRYVVAWEVSETMETAFCTTALRSALARATPEIHNSDQGSQFTSEAYTTILTRSGVQISMDGRGRCMDNIFTERLWRSVKYEEIYLKEYRDLSDAHEGLGDYFTFYNTKRRHQSLGRRTPVEVYLHS